MSKALGKFSKVLSIAATVAIVAFPPAAPFLALAATVTATASQMLAKPPPQQGSVTQTIIDPDAPQPYIMGGMYFAGIMRHREAYGGVIDGVTNPYLAEVVCYSGCGPVQSITPQIDFDTVPAWYSTYLYTDSQLGATPESTALAPNWSGMASWGSSSKLSGYAALLWNYKFDKTGKKFANGKPNTGAYVEGVKVYDPRLDSTFPGGSGACRVDDETTYVYDENPALHAGQYAYGRFQSSKRAFGIGIPDGGIDWQVIADWANVCDTNTWTIAGVVFEPGDRGQNLVDICAAGSADPAIGSTLSFRYDAPVIALDTITEADIADEDMSVVAMQGYVDRVNTVVPVYRGGADYNWEMIAAEPVINSTTITEDGEERRVEWPFNLVKDKDQAAQLAAYRLMNSRELWPIELVVSPRFRSYRPGDCLELDLPSLGLATDAVILNRQIDPATMKVRLTLRGETSAKHTFALGKTGVAPPTPALGLSAEDRDEAKSSVTNPRWGDIANDVGEPTGTVVASVVTTGGMVAVDKVDNASIVAGAVIATPGNVATSSTTISSGSYTWQDCDSFTFTATGVEVTVTADFNIEVVDNCKYKYRLRSGGSTLGREVGPITVSTGDQPGASITRRFTPSAGSVTITLQAACNDANDIIIHDPVFGGVENRNV